MIKKWTKFHDERAELHVESARRGGIWAIYKLFNRYYLKSFFGPFFTFVFPVLIFAILGSIMPAQLMFAGIVAMSGMSTGITGMPFAIMELKKSVLLKRIGASPVKPSKFTIVILTYFTVTIFVSVLWMMLWACIIHPNEVDTFFDGLAANNGLSALGFFWGNILNIAMSLSIGFFIASISKGEQQAQAIGMLIYFPSTFLAGQFITMDQIAANEAMNWISKFVPFRYTTMLITGAWQGANVFVPDAIYIPAVANMSLDAINHISPSIGSTGVFVDQATLAGAGLENVTSGAFYTSGGLTIPGEKPMGWIYPTKTQIYAWYEPIIGYVVPLSFIAAFTGLSIWKFRWSNAR